MGINYSKNDVIIIEPKPKETIITYNIEPLGYGNKNLFKMKPHFK